MNRCPSQRPKRDEWHERDHNLEDAATVTGLTISCESWYRAPCDISCWRSNECAFFYHRLHHQRCGVSPRCAAETGSAIDHEIEPVEIAPRDHFVVVVIPMKQTIEVGRFHRQGGAAMPST